MERLKPIDLSDHTFVRLEKLIKSPTDVRKWETSLAYQDLVGFILYLNEMVKSSSLQDECHVSQTMKNLEGVMSKLSDWIDLIPPVDQPHRFGNKAFRTWFDKLEEHHKDLLREALPDRFHPAVDEISSYLVDSVGNSTRIDYGTGHEASFVMFLYCLYKIGALTAEDGRATVLRLFHSYLHLVHKLLKRYHMEPAGSHGVWSLDDFHFIPFIWGSSQLIGHPNLQPAHFPDQGVAEFYAKDYLFMFCIDYVQKVKTGPFAEHSNQLWNISGAASWSKINTGLVKMYKAEVLSKFPVVQHIQFGSLLSLAPVTPSDQVTSVMPPPLAPIT